MQYLQSITTSIMPRISYVKKITNDGATRPKNDALAAATTDKDDAIDADNIMTPALLMTTDESNHSAEFIDDSNRSCDVDCKEQSIIEKSISNESPTDKSSRTSLNKDVTTNNPATKDGLLHHHQPGGEQYSSSSSSQQQQYERIARCLMSERDARASIGHGEKQSFLYALHDIIEVHSSSSSDEHPNNNNTNPIISWLPHGQGFIINDKQSFEHSILPSFLPNTKYASFTRRLKRWKFVRYVFVFAWYT